MSVARRGEKLSFLVRVEPADEGVIDQGILDIHTGGDRRVNPRKFFNGQNRHKETGIRAAIAGGDFDAHDPQVKELGNQLLGDLGRAVHLHDVGFDLFLGELPHHRPK